MSEYIITQKQIDALRGLASEVNGSEICDHITVVQDMLDKRNVRIGVNGDWLISWNYEFNSELSDMPEVVRCRECKWRAGQNRHAIHPNMCLFFSCDTEPDGFCKWGVRA